MADVFDYEPLLARIHDLVQSQHFETQEMLLTRMLHLCAVYQAIESVDIRLKKYRRAEVDASLRPPIGVRLVLTKDQLARLC
jgi:dihydroneopterin aldolase